MKAMKIERWDYKELFDKEFERHMDTKDKYLKQIEENVRLMEENDELIKKLAECKDKIMALEWQIDHPYDEYYEDDEEYEINCYYDSYID